MNKLRLLNLVLLFAITGRAYAQDERYFRKLFSGELRKSFEVEIAKKYSAVVHTSAYALDLNRDGKSEYIVFVKKDGEDWLDILDNEKRKIFSYQFDVKGFDSELFRMEYKTLAPHSSVLLLYYYEGLSRYLEYQGSARIYAITIDDNDLKTLSAFKGASFFDEVQPFKGHYHYREYQVYLEDLNKDSTKELLIKYRNISTVFWYRGMGKWGNL